MDTLQKLLEFAGKHNIALEQRGEVGFGRPCVGFLKGDNYINHNPMRASDYEYVWPFDEELYAPLGVEAYHKHDCLAVLVEDDNYGEGLRQLALWVDHLESLGEVKVEQYATGATGMQALFSGVHGYAIRVVRS